MFEKNFRKILKRLAMKGKSEEEGWRVFIPPTLIVEWNEMNKQIFTLVC